MKKTILIAAVLFFAFSVAASAQALFQVGSTPVTTVASCGSTELTGDIVFTQVDGSPTIKTGTITISYGVPITNTATAAVSVVDSNNTPISGVAALVPIVFGTPSQLVLTLNPPTSGVAPYTIRVSGVRVNVAGNPALTSLSANVSSTVNSFVGGQTNVVVISSIASAIASIDTITGSGFTAVNTALNINSVSTSGLGTVSVDVNEGFANAFVQNAIVGLTFSAIPAGLSVTLPATVSTASGDTFTMTDADGAALASPFTGLTSASTNLAVYYKLATATAAGSVASETLRIPVTVALAFGAPSPLPQGTISVTADMYPKTKAFPNYLVVPQYTGTTCQKGPVTILTIVTGNTVLLVPYAVSSAGYDTGLAIANTTKDPLSLFQTAIPQNGNITFTFYPQTGASFSYTTSATSPGAGLTSGTLNAGGLYTVLLSQLVAAAGGPKDFSGYIFAVVAATNAHGQYFISDFEAFTNGALMLVIDPATRNAAPEKLQN